MIVILTLINLAEVEILVRKLIVSKLLCKGRQLPLGYFLEMECGRNSENRSNSAVVVLHAVWKIPQILLFI